MAGKEYVGKGDSVYDALKEIPLEWNEITLKGVIKVQKGKQVFEKLYPLLKLRKIFVSKLNRQVAGNNLQFLVNNS